MEMEAYCDLGSALNDKFRGNGARNWTEWQAKHAFQAASDIPEGATIAWIGRQKLNYRGIGNLQALQHLVCGNVDQPFLEEIGQVENLNRLELEWPMVAKDLTPILALNQLDFLTIDSPRHIADFRPLLTLPRLRTLIITNPKKMVDLTWLSDAHHLEAIGIEGGMWSPYKISSLQPLAGLRSLRAFLGVSTKLADKHLGALAECPKLEFLKIAQVAPQEEFLRLAALKPHLICDWFRPEMWRALGS